MATVQVQSSIYITCGKSNINSALRGISASVSEANEPTEDGGSSWERLGKLKILTGEWRDRFIIYR